MYAPTLSPLKHFSTPIFNLPSVGGKNFKTHLLERGYPENFIQTTFSEVTGTFEDRNQALRQKQNKKIRPFVTQYHPACSA